MIPSPLLTLSAVTTQTGGGERLLWIASRAGLLRIRGSDTALRAVAQALESATREQDLVARFGGEEFACLLIDAPEDIVAAIAERMRALVEALPPRTLGNDSDTLTISAGILRRIPSVGERAADLLSEADAALYAAKHASRNQVVAASKRIESETSV